MVTSLNEAKRLIKARLMGQAGVHAVGVRKTANAVAVYVDVDANEEIRTLASQLKPAVEPYDIVIVPEARASITPSGG